ncbi:MAG: Sensor histidine kinase RcsC [Holosporales bacterium]
MSVFYKNNRAVLQIIVLGVVIFNILFGFLFYFNEKRDFKNYAERASFMIAHQFIKLLDPSIVEESKRHDHLKSISKLFKQNAEDIGLLNISVFDQSGSLVFSTIKNPDVFVYKKDTSTKIMNAYCQEYRSINGLKNGVYVSSLIIDDIQKSPFVFRIDLDMTKEYDAAMADIKTYTGSIFILSLIFFSILLFVVRMYSKKIHHYCMVIEEQRDQTEKLSHIREDFFTTAAHELRTPINGFLGAIELLKETKTTEKQTELLHIADFSAKHLLNVLNELLDFSKLEQGKLVLEKIPFNLFTQIQSLVDMNCILAEKKGIHLTYQTTLGQDFYVESDPLRINQIIQNLLSNALKFTPEKGSIMIKVDVNDKGLVFVIKDTGIGIAEDKICELFKKYTQIKDSTSRLYGGTGLGLSITKNLVTLLNGTITVESVEGNGTTFCVMLPLKKTNLNLVEEAANPLSLLNTKTMLVVDDNVINQMILKGFLEKYHHFVETASSGGEALLKIKEKDFDYVFMDISMPDINGVDVARQIRVFDTHNNKKRRIIIACSANTLEADQEADFDGQLLKPIDLKKLLALFLKH